MPTKPPSPVQELEQILHRYEEIKGTSYSDLRHDSEEEQIEIITSMVAAIERLSPQGSYYITGLLNANKVYGLERYEAIPSLVGIIKALKTAYESGYLHKIEELIHADLFSNFLEMGEYLLNDGYKDPAAVIIGGVLEEHLRRLCIKHSITITVAGRPKKAELMNSELAKANVYNVLDQKSVTAWLDLRNKAAHSKYSEYTQEQVQIMLLGIRNFASRFPA